MKTYKQRDQKIKGRCRALSDVIAAIRPTYIAADPDQKRFIETVVGAALWYLPQTQDSWTGYVSLGVLKLYHPDSGHAKPKHSDEHKHPRKIAAQTILADRSLSGARLEKLYITRFSRIHYITPNENKTAQRHQRSDVFTTAKGVYSKAKINLIRVKRNDLPHILKRDCKLPLKRDRSNVELSASVGNAEEFKHETVTIQRSSDSGDVEGGGVG